MNNIRRYLDGLHEILDKLPVERVEQVADVLYRAYTHDRSVFLFGNGGSAALASHIACDWGKGTFAPQHSPLPGVKRFKVLSLADNMPMLTAWANDTAYENVFAEQLANFLQPEDVALAISSSGNSPSVLKALRLGREKGGVTVGLGGCGGGKMLELLDYSIVVPSSSVQQVEDAHLIVAHLIFLSLRERIAESAA